MITSAVRGVMLKMVKARMMLRVVVYGDDLRYDPPELYAPQLVEIKEKIAILRMAEEGAYVLTVGSRHNDVIFYIELSKENRNAS